ncbi:MAG: biotin--[acetyl-CoA-carboxylase] ligase [Actinomycetota bacterium]|nr:biotin--[acetyl-CoA-carboxylase] ligase [Actinomycetota bacterium]
MGDGGASRFADVHRHREVDSTNRVVADLARQGAAEGLVVIADHQTAGRGRWGRRWDAPPGSSLLVSVLLRPRPLVTLASGIAAADACASAAGVAAGLKWPNDLMAGDRKLGGILTELVTDGPAPAAVVGVGINVNWTGALPGGAVSLNHLTGEAVERDLLLDAFLTQLDAVLNELDGPDGPTAVVDRYRELSGTLGRTVTVSTPRGDIVGWAADVGREGQLVLETDDGRRHEVAAGIVTHVDQGGAPIAGI